MTIRIDRAASEHAGEIMTVQRAAYVDEARQNDVQVIPPLVETLDEIAGDLGFAFAAWDGPRLVGSIRGHLDGDRLKIARLSVAPDMQGRGIGKRLLAALVDARPDEVRLLWLVTGARSEANIRLYTNAGFVRTGTGFDEMNVPIVFLEQKVISRSG